MGNVDSPADRWAAEDKKRKMYNGLEEQEYLARKAAGVQMLPGIHPRVETGPVKFGEDWTGVFIRVDNALAYMVTLEDAIRQIEAIPFEKRETGMVLTLTYLRGLRELLAGSDERKWRT